MKLGSTNKLLVFFPNLSFPHVGNTINKGLFWKPEASKASYGSISYSCGLSVTSLQQMCPLIFISTGIMLVLPHSPTWTIAEAFPWILLPLSIPIFPSTHSPHSSQDDLWNYTADHSILMIKMLQFSFSWRTTKLPDILPETSQEPLLFFWSLLCPSPYSGHTFSFSSSFSTTISVLRWFMCLICPELSPIDYPCSSVYTLCSFG